MNIKLIVKVPNHKNGDRSYDIKLDANWTVKQLKTFLSSEYPSKPSVSDQKLIYSGHLLNDDQNLLQVFQPLSNSESIVTIHMVCPVKTAEAMKIDQSSARGTIIDNSAHRDSLDSNRNHMHSNFLNDMNALHANDNTVHHTQAQAATAAALTSSIFSQMNAFSAQNVNATTVPPAMVNAYSPYATSSVAMPALSGQSLNLSPEEARTLNQLYTRFVSNQLNNTYPATVPGLWNPLFFNPLLVNGQLTPVTVQQQQPQVAAVQQPPPPPPVVNYNDDNNDWLEWLHWISRVAVLLSIVYFYSSLTRFILVMSFPLFLYLYQSGLLFRNNHQQQEAQDVPPVPQDPEPVDDGQDAQDAGRAPEILGLRARRRITPQVPETHDTTSHATATVPEERSSGIRVLWLVVSSFLTSLIPEQQHFNLN